MRVRRRLFLRLHLTLCSLWFGCYWRFENLTKEKIFGLLLLHLLLEMPNVLFFPTGKTMVYVIRLKIVHFVELWLYLSRRESLSVL